MPEDRIYEDLTAIRRRARTVFWAFAGLAFLVLAYYWKIQILEHKKYSDLAEANRTRTRVLTAPRGLILARDRTILADNSAAFKVSLVRENVKDEAASYAAVSRLLGIDEATVRDRVALHKDLPLFEPVVIADGLTAEAIAPIESRRLELPELTVESEPQRIYRGGTRSAHILGYLQEPTLEEIRVRPERRYVPGELVGKAGVERVYDDILRGQDGQSIDVVDSLGRVVGVKAHVNPTQGDDLVLTVDVALQDAAEAALEGREGVVIVLDPSNGDVLALASSPTYDPNRFITRFTPKEWTDLISDPASPLENRAIRGLYAPGSLFKPVMGLAGLTYGYVGPATTVYCTGSVPIYGAVRHCWFEPGHGALNLAGAIRNSCNIYFYALGQKMPIDEIADVASLLGLGQRTGIDLAGEKEGLVPTEDWKKKTLKERWYPGETVSVAIGQGQVTVTPLQAAALTAVIARRGQPVRPHLAVRAAPEPLPPVARLKRQDFEEIIAGMWGSVNDGGTGAGAFVEGLDICGKTGSTQTMSRESAERLARAGKIVKTHSWFSGFAPRADPKVVVTVLVEYGGGGGATAAPVAGRLFALWRERLGPR